MSRTIKIGIFLTVSILLTTFTFYFWQIFKSPNLQVREGDKTFALLIPRGSTFESVIDTLQKHKVLNDEMSFRFLAKLMKYPELVKEGRYEIRPRAGNREVLVKLRNGSQDPMMLTFNSMRQKSDLIQRVGSKFAFGSEALGELLNDPATCEKFGFDTTTIVCLFLPNTYELFWTIKPDAFLERMGSEYKKFWTPERQSKAKALGLTQTQTQVLASIVAAETNKRDEQPRVAGVYLNRLKRGIKLEADPTVIFALRDFSIRRLLNKQLTIDSPYNTYRYAGLPPGPINLPAPATIDAVLNAEQHDYLYFVVDARFNGYHTFSKTLAEHLANARLYQQALNRMKIMK
ncbi:endolytic transglycosylase MltG [Spirosoma montaniterrae]|uniref:Endolytic murein transglycosylase n=1 Tax=Spirosoma montaniterrae TaxID=1178516 RepID=A0A1P9WUA4_9BACT|nr:endolytic transglycosylase MltG [Spirosoma montaniterrae]AQG78957.1 aminodeoxychorismate lyase [Spirosoma montaniterrae]